MRLSPVKKINNSYFVAGTNQIFGRSSLLFVEFNIFLKPYFNLHKGSLITYK